jgi:hypothetical protein
MMLPVRHPSALTGILVHHIGPTLFFPIAGAGDGPSARDDGTYLLVGSPDTVGRR